MSNFLQTLKWRLEARRTGKSFADVVLLHTLLYRVEQIFLIHRETGLVLQHVTAGGSAAPEPEMVSGMLTALQDFVSDSFSSNHGDQLETVQVGELAVWIEPGPQAVLAGVIRGEAPPDLRAMFREQLERIHLEFNGALTEFDGDMTPFAATSPLLADCLHQEYAPSTHKITH